MKPTIKRALVLAMLALLGGCMTASTPPETRYWIVESVSERAAETKPKYDDLRILQLAVCSPYDDRNLVVMRADGSVAFDPYNQFAAIPATLLKSPVIDTVTASGMFESVVGQYSSRQTSISLEVLFKRIAYDCRDPENKQASVKVALRLLNERRDLIAMSIGEGTCAVNNGNFTEAFSKAVTSAVETALRKF